MSSKSDGWSGRFDEPVADFVLRYTASVGFDRRLAMADIEGSLAHAAMLARVGVIPTEDLAAIERGLAQIRSEIERGEFVWRLELEDVPTFGPAAMLAIVPYPPDMRLPLVDMWRASLEPGVGIVDPHRIEEQRHYFEPMMQREDLRYESHQPGSTF